MSSPLSGNIPVKSPVLTIGTFDGVHLGHRVILQEVQRYAMQLDGTSLVVTFEPHPRQVLQPESQIRILTPLDEKIALLREAGIEEVAVTPFTKDFAQLSAEAYVEEFLVARLRPAAVVIGYDHHYGHDRRGDIKMLEHFGKKHGFEVHEIPPHMIADAAISSTKIRNALLTGDVSLASKMLGRNYSVSGKVVHGEKLGRTLGYPTANIQPTHKAQLIPERGVYAARVTVNGIAYPSMLSIGVRPTINSNGIESIEAYLFNFNQDIYGSDVRVDFVRRMRDELKFDSLDALIEAIKEDERNARKILGIQDTPGQ